ncbi:MAG: tyrosine-type recombinase/integrase [Acidobacteria bacterium]|nr:tyrosine-type recombinase/integrase [Acidobacteriota bacterium]
MGQLDRTPEAARRKETALLDDFRRFLLAAGLRSTPSYLRDVERFITHLAEGGVEALAARSSDADAYRSALLLSGLSRATVNNVMNHLRRFYRWATRRRLTTTDPFITLRSLPTGRSLPKTILSVPDMGILLDRFALRNERDLMLKSVVELLYGSALRISEVESLRVPDIDFEAELILIHERKTGVSRKVPASQASLRSIRLYLEHARTVCTTEADRGSGFLYPQGGSTTLRCAVNAVLRRECRRLGLKQITTHSFRHAAATHLLRSGAGIRQVQAFLGHHTIGSTERYTHVVSEDLKTLIACWHPREAPP